ncbi:MAG TPA: hypothetical protein VEL07_19850 [Planctomycetota bacterium]|nr:hypothetical protein [Planctomycetota bacterium]
MNDIISIKRSELDIARGTLAEIEHQQNFHRGQVQAIESSHSHSWYDRQRKDEHRARADAMTELIRSKQLEVVALEAAVRAAEDEVDRQNSVRIARKPEHFARALTDPDTPIADIARRTGMNPYALLSFKVHDARQRKATLSQLAGGDELVQTFADLMASSFYRGFEEGQAAAAWQKVARKFLVTRWETLPPAGLSASQMPDVADGAAAAALTYVEQSSDQMDTSGNRGGVIEISHQDLYGMSPQGLADRFYRAGLLAARTVDRMVAAAIVAATWTNATSALAFSATNLVAALTAHAGLTLADSGPVPPARRIVVPSPLVPLARDSVNSIEAAVDGGPSVVAYGELSDLNDWYLASDPASLCAFHVLYPNYQPAPMLIPIAPGTTSKASWRIEHFVKVVTAYSAAGKPAGWHRFTA